MKKFFTFALCCFAILSANDPYGGKIKVEWKNNRMKGETDRLTYRSLVESDRSFLYKLLGNAKNVRWFGNSNLGEENTEGYLPRRVDVTMKRHLDRIKDGDPFHGHIILDKKSGKRVGYLACGHGESPGECEGAWILVPELWGQGYGKEVVHFFARGVGNSLKGKDMEGKPLTRISAMVQPQNIASIKCMEYAGMKKCTPPKEYNGEKPYYSFWLDGVDGQLADDGDSLVDGEETGGDVAVDSRIAA